ncbi:MAG TPA: Gfo/Idh/MocA family oxidoreductase [Candidatus Tyrphobacter sp.]
MTSPFNLGIVGVGAIGAVHVETAAALPEIRLTAVCDTRAGVAEEAARRTGARAYTRYQDLAYDERLDGVVICTPPSSHQMLTQFYLERGIDVLCEKPLATEGTAAREMYACAARNGRLLMLASKFRYVEGVMAARRLLHEGVLGSIRHAEIVFVSNVDMSSRWNADPLQSGGGVVIDNGTHAVDLCRYLFGPVNSVAAVAYARGKALPVEDSAYLYLGVANGIGVTVDISWSLDRKFEHYIRLYGEHARLFVGWQETTLSRGSREPTVIAPAYSRPQAFLALQRDFVLTATGRGRPRTDVSDALASVDVVDAAYASIREGGRTAVEAERAIAV